MQRKTLSYLLATAVVLSAGLAHASETIIWDPLAREANVTALSAALAPIDTALNGAATVSVSGGGTALQTAITAAGAGAVIEITDSMDYDAVSISGKSGLYIRAAAGQAPTITSAGAGSQCVSLTGSNVDIGLQGLTFLVDDLLNGGSQPQNGAIKCTDELQLERFLMQDCEFQPINSTDAAVVAVQFGHSAGVTTNHRDIGIRRCVFDSTGTYTDATSQDLACVSISDFENVLISNCHFLRTTTFPTSHMRGVRAHFFNGLIEYCYFEDLGTNGSNECVKVSGDSGPALGSMTGFDVAVSNCVGLDFKRFLRCAELASTITATHCVGVTGNAERTLRIDTATATVNLQDSIFEDTNTGTSLLHTGASGTLNVDHNLYFNWTSLGFTADGTDIVGSDPLLVAPTAAGDDYTLAAGSPGLGAGTGGDDMGLLLIGPPDTVYVDDDYADNSPGDMVNFPDDGGVGPFEVGFDAFATIQEGIDGVGDSTVNVAAGVYTAVDRALAIIDKPLTLVGAGESDDGSGTVLDGGTYGAGTDTTGLGNGWPRAIVVQAHNVTIRNMRIREYQGDQSTVGGYAIAARASSAWGVPTSTIDNLLVEDVTFEDCYYGVRCESHNGATIQRTTFGADDGATGYAQYVSYSDGTTIRANTVNNGSIWVTAATNALIGGAAPADGNIVTDATYNGIWLGQQFAAGTGSDGTVQYNTVNGAVEGGIVIWNWAGESTAGIQILDNLVSGTGDPGWDPNGGIAIYSVDSTPLEIRRNEVTGAASVGLRLQGVTLDNVQITNNIFTGSTDADVTLASATLVDVVFFDNALGSMTVTGGTGTLDASGNWWGTAIPADVKTGANGGTRVDYTPWLDAGTDTDAGARGFAGDFSTLNVDDDSPQVGSTGRIQEGVDLVTASTVNILPGTYEEQIVIDMDDLNLIGSGSGTNPAVDSIIQSPVSLTYFFDSGANDNYPVIGVHDATGVSIENLRVDGLGRGNGNNRFVGIGIWNAGADVTDCAITSVRDTPFSGVQHGVAIYAFNDTGGPYTINVAGTDIDDYQKNAMALLGTGLTANVSGSTTTGAGATAVTAQNGIQIGAGAGGTISGCTVSGNLYTGGTWASTGVLLMGGTNVDVTGTVITDNHPGVYIIDTSGTFDGNTVSNQDPDSWDGLYAFNSATPFNGGGKEPRRVAAPFDGDAAQQSGTNRLAAGAMSVIVTGSDFIGHDKADSWGVSAFSTGPVSILTLTGSNVSDFDWGVVAYDFGGPVELTASNNAITSNVTYGYSSNVADLQNASANYWGSTDAATVAALISGDIDYTPWLGGGTNNSPGFTGDFSTLYVDDDSQQIGAQDRISEAIDLVSGSTVIVAAGTYNTRLTITKSVDLLGAQAGVDPTSSGARTTPAAESVITESGLSTPNPDVLIEIPSGVTNVTIDGFTLEGDPTNGTADTSTIRAWDDDLTISNNIMDGRQVVIYKGGSNLVFDRNRVTANKNGVVCQPNTATNAVISNNVFTLGSSPAGGEDAIHLSGTVDSHVTGNTATGFVNGKGVGGSGQTNLEVSGNTFTGNKDAVSFWGTTTFVTISDNNLSGSLRYGISIKGQDISITNNRIMGSSDSGINIERHVIDTERVSVNFNTIIGNGSFGVKVNTATVLEVIDAENNYWGSSSGPEDLLGTDEADNPPCFDPATMKNADGTGNAVTDLGVDYCPWLLGEGSMTLEVPAGCQSDTQIEVQLWMRDLAKNANGFQAFLEYDDSVLSYNGGASDYTSSPFPLHIQPIGSAEVSPGKLNLDGSDSFGGDGTNVDSLLATLVFDVSIDCGPTSVDFDTGGPFPSELSFDGTALPTNLANTPSLTLDDTNPSATQGTIDSCYDTAALADAAALAATTALTDNCGSGGVSKAVQTGAGDCDTSIVIRVTDSCGNFTDYTYNTRVDNVPPTFDLPADITKNADAGGCTLTLTEAEIDEPTNISDGCGSIPFTVTWSRSDSATNIDDPFDAADSPITITWKVEDDCGNFETATVLTEQIITVNAVNDVDVVVELVGVFNDALPLTRCIHFVTNDCGVTADFELDFFDHDTNGVTSVRTVAATIQVACGSYVSLCAKDEQHTKYETTTLTDAGAIYTADTLLSLRGGDTDNDSDVDINDVTLLLAQFGDPASDGDCAWDGTRDTDFSNNGVVASEDYSILTANWLTFSSCSCSSAANGPDDDDEGVATSVSVFDLPIDVAKKADLNGDGVVDYRDVRLFELRNGLPQELSTLIEASMSPRG